jgi:hypothetical protein
MLSSSKIPNLLKTLLYNFLRQRCMFLMSLPRLYPLSTRVLNILWRWKVKISNLVQILPYRRTRDFCLRLHTYPKGYKPLQGSQCYSEGSNCYWDGLNQKRRSECYWEGRNYYWERTVVKFIVCYSHLLNMPYLYRTVGHQECFDLSS